LKEKGYIGSIGDDLPSLIPLLFALLIFFTVFSFTLNIFNEKKTAFEKEFELMQIADSLKYDGYINGFNELSESGDLLPNTFLALCNSVSVLRTKFRAGLTNNLTAPEQSNFEFNLFGDDLFYSSNGNEFVCSNADESDFFALDSKRNPNMRVRIYPVVLDEEKVVKPMHLVVVSWN
jgi:hypothetical protein